MKRSIWKGNYISKYLLSNKFKKQNKKIVWSRNSAVPENLIGDAVFIHNGKNFVKSYITREKVGFKFGEFAYTKKFTKKQNKVKNKKK
jgi:small subunit ribosomal protein S19